MSAETIKIELNSDEALVLFEFLSRFSDTDELKIEDQSEERVLWNMCCDLEKKVSVHFSDKYGRLLEQARARTRDKLE